MKQKFTIKTNSPSANLNKPHFYVLSKGLNSGKPLDAPCPNCFIITTGKEALKEQLYWLCHSLWQSKALHKYLRGSVIPFISIVEFRKVLSLNFEEAVKDEPRFKKSVQALQALDKKQCQYSKNIRLIEEAKRIVMYRYIKRR